MQRQAVDGERRRINWGDLLDEAWGKEEPLTQPPGTEAWPSCEDPQGDKDKENFTESATNRVRKPAGTASSVEGGKKLGTETGVFPGGKLFPEISKSSKTGANRNGKRLRRGAALGPTARANARARNAPPPRASGNKLQRKRSAAGQGDRKRREHLRQLCLDLGQKNFGHVTCRACGMVYSLGQAQDEADHSRFHRRYLAGVSFHGWKGERVADEFFDGRILVVYPDDRRNHLRKVQELCALVDSELGFAAGVSPWRPTTKMYLYVSTAKKVMGCVFAERVSEGYPVLGSNLPQDTLAPQSSMTSSNLAQSSMTSLKMTSLSVTSSLCHLDSQSAWYCSSTPMPAVVGVNRVWVCRQHRRRGVASRILDTIRFNFIPGSVISKDQLAFSDPTPSGKAFAASYCGTENFLVYHWTT